MNKKRLFLTLLIALIAVSAVAITSLSIPYPLRNSAAKGDRWGDDKTITVLESNLIHVDTGGGDALVNKGDPVVITGSSPVIGVALSSVAAATDNVVVDTEGIYYVQREDESGSGGVSITIGDAVYIGVSSGALGTTPTTMLFGYSMYNGTITSSSTSIFPVKLARP